MPEAAEKPSPATEPRRESREERGSGNASRPRRRTLRTRRCPTCHSRGISRSRRRGFLEVFLLPLFLHRPFKCEQCSKRFYGFSAGRRTLRMALIALVLLALGGGSLWAIWRVISAITH